MLCGVGYPRVSVRVGGGEWILIVSHCNKKCLEVTGYVENEIQSWQIASAPSLPRTLYIWHCWPKRLIIPIDVAQGYMHIKLNEVHINMLLVKQQVHLPIEQTTGVPTKLEVAAMVARRFGEPEPEYLSFDAT